mmetsp:Transcript_40110/g.125839  ORF Transcript_40110/g.125839 Transcript_40110/m.125839 type:complete len:358 (-) Transcript_40110:510-1583(-)
MEEGVTVVTVGTPPAGAAVWNIARDGSVAIGTATAPTTGQPPPPTHPHPPAGGIGLVTSCEASDAPDDCRYCGDCTRARLPRLARRRRRSTRQPAARASRRRGTPTAGRNQSQKKAVTRREVVSAAARAARARRQPARSPMAGPMHGIRSGAIAIGRVNRTRPSQNRKSERRRRAQTWPAASACSASNNSSSGTAPSRSSLSVCLSPATFALTPDRHGTITPPAPTAASTDASEAALTAQRTRVSPTRGPPGGALVAQAPSQRQFWGRSEARGSVAGSPRSTSEAGVRGRRDLSCPSCALFSLAASPTRIAPDSAVCLPLSGDAGRGGLQWPCPAWHSVERMQGSVGRLWSQFCGDG